MVQQSGVDQGIVQDYVGLPERFSAFQGQQIRVSRASPDQGEVWLVLHGLGFVVIVDNEFLFPTGFLELLPSYSLG